MFWMLEKQPKENIAYCDADSGHDITYAALRALSDPLVAGLKSEGKKLAFVIADNSFSSVLVYLSMLRSGQAVCMLDAKMDRSLLKNLVTRYSPEIIWDSQGSPEKYVSTGSVETYAGEQFLIQDATAAPVHQDLGLLLSTSGSTGSPKLVRLSYDNLHSNTQSIVEYLALQATDRGITTLPLSYSFGLSLIHTHLLAAASMVTTRESIISRSFWDTVKAKGCTSISGVPWTYETLLKLRFGSMDLPALKTLTQAGGALSARLQAQFHQIARDKSLEFFIMYGQTEATARIAYVPEAQLADKIGSIGVSIPGGKLTLTDVDPDTGHGELRYQGENVMMGYASSREDLSKEDELRGILYTGDIARQDNDGFFYIVGRKKRFIKIFGLRVNLDELQETLSSRLDSGIVCVGRDDLLLILVESNSRETADEAKKLVIDLYAFHHSAVRADTIDSIPRNAAGKIQYADLTARFLQ